MSIKLDYEALVILESCRIRLIGELKVYLKQEKKKAVSVHLPENDLHGLKFNMALICIGLY